MRPPHDKTRALMQIAAAVVASAAAQPVGIAERGREHEILCFDSPEYGHDVECECWCHGDEPVAAEGRESL